MVGGANEVLERHAPALNAINVYPVPDGDTGTNMHLTFRAGKEGVDRLNDGSVFEAAAALAKGALMGARGNSGVILSQVLRGFAQGLSGHDQADGPAIAAALSAASEAAYQALSEPREGTILTVCREAAEAVSQPPDSPEETLERAIAAANESVERTPELLPVLKDAGVVDAGGLGLAIILEGLLRGLRGDPLDVDLAPDIAIGEQWKSDAASFHEAHAGETGYCTEFVVNGRGIDADGARDEFGKLGTSVLVVGGDDVLRVHVHTIDPDEAISRGRALGEVTHVKVDNMEAQIERFVSAPVNEPVAAGIDVVAVAAGDGIETVFRGIGVSHVVAGGQTMNPSAGELLAAIEACKDDEVVVLPNNKNIIAAAEQAAAESTKHVVVVPSRTIPQGIAAVLTLNSDVSFDANAEAMRSALTTVRSAEVTRAVRGATIDGRRVEVGQAIGIIDGELRVVEDDVNVAAVHCVQEMASDGAALVTVYAGAETRGADAQELMATLGDVLPGIEVDLVQGGQPHYHYIISLE
jgi:DAK2 domain fusion protein YloV